MIAVVREVPEEGGAFGGRPVADEPGETHAVPMLVGARGGTDHLEDRGIEIGADHRDAADGAVGAAAGPADEERHTDAAFVEPALGTAERHVGGREGTVEGGGSDDAIGLAEVGGGHAAVVGGENDDGVFGEAERLERGDHAAEALVHVFDHRGELNVVLVLFDFHRLLREDLVAAVVRRRDDGVEVGAGSGMRGVGVALEDEGGAGGPGEAVAFRLIFGDEVGAALDGVVDGEMREVEEERAVAVLLDVGEGLVGEAVGEVIAGGIGEAVEFEGRVVAGVRPAFIPAPGPARRSRAGAGRRDPRRGATCRSGRWRSRVP